VKALYHLTQADMRDKPLLATLGKYDLIVCEQAMDPARIRQHTDAMLLAGRPDSLRAGNGPRADPAAYRRDVACR
jgi:hypothetical protein